MSLFKEEAHLVKEEKDLDNITGSLMPDRIIQMGETPYPNRRGHNYELRTMLEDNLLPKASITSLNKSLNNLGKHIDIEAHASKSLVNILINCRDYIDVYFKTTRTNPMYINFFYKGSQDIDILKKMINDAKAGIDYFGGNVLSKNMQEHITVTSLYLREIIANTVGFKEVAHRPSQVIDKLSKYKLRAFLLDSHYSLGEKGNIIDSRKIIY